MSGGSFRVVVGKGEILDAIRRTAAANGGQPLGRERFARETGIRQSDWLGKYWARWGDALLEAGFEPNRWQGRYGGDVLGVLVAEVRRLGRMPTDAELKMRRREDGSFPSLVVFSRWGSKAELVASLLAYCRERSGCGDVEEVLAGLVEESAGRSPSTGEDGADVDPGAYGFVYLLKSGRYYKIGRSNAAGRRERELALQLPERAVRVHVIETDDPAGIERYWHHRFADRRKNGEWFDLTAADVRAFKLRRKFM